MDIGSGTGYPSANLSNFHPHAFTIDGIACASMEGFLQSLKFENPDMQAQVCTLVGKKGKIYKTRHDYCRRISKILKNENTDKKISRCRRSFAKNIDALFHQFQR